MNMKAIVYTSTNGNLCIVHPAPNGRFANELEADWLTRVLNKTVSEDERASAIIVDVEEIPTNREFRDAFELSEGKIQINFDKAKNICHNKLLQKLEGKMKEAIYEETWNDDSSKKNTLKTLKNRIESDILAFSTIEELVAYQPAELE
jgi:hypothetical protein